MYTHCVCRQQLHPFLTSNFCSRNEALSGFRHQSRFLQKLELQHHDDEFLLLLITFSVLVGLLRPILPTTLPRIHSTMASRNRTNAYPHAWTGHI
jgi:hypothetical protein